MLSLISNHFSSFLCYPKGLPHIRGVYRVCRVGQNHNFVGIYSVYTVFLAGK